MTRATVAEDSGANAIAVLANDTDPDTGDHPDRHRASPSPPTAPWSSPAAAPGSPTPPTPNFAGTDTFTYTITDGAVATDTATVSITVTAVNDAPTAAATSPAPWPRTPPTLPSI